MQPRAQISALANLSGEELLVKSASVQKLSKVTYEQVVNHVKKFDFSLHKLSKVLHT